MRIALPRTVVKNALRVGLRPVLGPPVPLPVQRAWMTLLAAGLPVPEGVEVVRTTAGGVPAERLVPTGADPARAVLLLHGGAFITGSPTTHRGFAALLARAAGCAVTVLDYRLAPEHPWPAAEHDAVAAYDELSAGARTSVVGDSAGGALAMLLARSRRPAAIALVSPLVDLTRESSRDWTGEDVLVRNGWARQGTEAFVGGADARSLSPLFDDLAGLPPLLVHVSEHERLRPEGERLAARAAEAGVDVSLVRLDGLWHDPHVQAGVLPEAAEAVASMGRWLAARG